MCSSSNTGDAVTKKLIEKSKGVEMAMQALTVKINVGNLPTSTKSILETFLKAGLVEAGNSYTLNTEQQRKYGISPGLLSSALQTLITIAFDSSGTAVSVTNSLVRSYATARDSDDVVFDLNFNIEP